jgi:hypothetical protein
VPRTPCQSPPGRLAIAGLAARATLDLELNQDTTRHMMQVKSRHSSL